MVLVRVKLSGGEEVSKQHRDMLWLVHPREVPGVGHNLKTGF